MSAPNWNILKADVERWIFLQEQIDAHQVAYRKGEAPYDMRVPTGSNANWVLLMNNIEPLFESQKRLFEGRPFECMVWEEWIKPWLADNPGRDWIDAPFPDWVGAAFSFFDNGEYDENVGD